jgi:hypothetical protein
MPTVSVPLRASPAFVFSAARPSPSAADAGAAECECGDYVRSSARDERERDESQCEQRRAAADAVQGWKPALEGTDRERRCREHADVAAPPIGEYPQTVITRRTARKSTPTRAPKSRPRRAC